MNKKYIRLIILFHLIIIYLSQGVAQIKQLTPAQKEKQTIVALEDSLFSASNGPRLCEGADFSIRLPSEDGTLNITKIFERKQ